MSYENERLCCLGCCAYQRYVHQQSLSLGSTSNMDYHNTTTADMEMMIKISAAAVYSPCIALFHVSSYMHMYM